MIPVPPAIIERVDATLAAVNADSPDRLQASFAPGARVVDNFSPFLWSGPQSAASWWRAVDRYGKRADLDGLHARLRSIGEWKLDPNGDAYVVANLHIAFRSNPKVSENGAWVLTLHRTGNDWKITSAAWATTH